MSMQEEEQALLRSGLLPPRSSLEQTLWGEISGGRFDVREGILYLADDWWGFYGRDFEFLTPYAGFVAHIPSIIELRGPFSLGTTVGGYKLEGEIEGEGQQLYTFLPNEEMYVRNQEVVTHFFDTLRDRVNQLLHPDAQAPYDKGHSAWSNGDLQAAEEFFWQAYRLDPRSPEPAFALGQLFLDHDPKEALKLLIEAEKRGYADERALAFAQTRAYIGLGQFQEAERKVNALVRRQEDAEGYFLRAQIEAAQERKLDAIMSLKRACGLDNRNVEYQAALAYRAANFGELEVASQAIQRLEHMHASHPGLSMAQALIAHAHEDEERAIQCLKEALQQAPQWEEARQMLHDLGGDEPAHAEADERVAAPLTEDEVERRLDLFIESDLEASCHNLREMISHFALCWGPQIPTQHENAEEKGALIRAMHDAIRIALRSEIDAMKPSLRGGVTRDFEEFALSLPHEASEEFLEHSDRILRDLDASLEQVAQYGFGLLDGGIFMRIFDRVEQFPLDPHDDLAEELEEKLSLLEHKLRNVLQMWGELFFDQLFEWIEPFTEGFVPEEEEDDDIIELTEDALEEDDEYEIPPTSLLNFVDDDEDEEEDDLFNPPTTIMTRPPMLDVTPHAPRTQAVRTPAPMTTHPSQMRKIAAMTPTSIQHNTQPREAQSPRPRMPIAPSVAMRLQNTVRHSDRLKRKEETTTSYEKIFQEYIAAHEFIGVQPQYGNLAQFTRYVEKEVQHWTSQTGKPADLYIRIEQGRPQVKIREQ
ncbi:MAG TPA: hypothetical protein DCE42_15515 [Myxococcales bacterium]|nr:hypothetical protein [Deltaproteobacteria bacterium]HAA56172.1 hypothetical protein [Myxococcales bacterium]